MNKTLSPYVGICDFMSPHQVFDMMAAFEQYKQTGVSLMAGTMTSYKVMYDLETKWSDIFPKVSELKGIFSMRYDQLINCIHYADYDNFPQLSETLDAVATACGPYLDAVQLDMVWPDPKELELFQKKWSIPLVLQVSAKSMNLCADNPITVAKKIDSEYDGLIAHVLLDCSMGKGVAIDIPFMEGYIECIRTYADSVPIAVAGGLGPQSVHTVAELVRKYRVSMDAQSKLRPSGKTADPIDWDMAKEYLHNAMHLYI